MALSETQAVEDVKRSSPLVALRAALAGVVEFRRIRPTSTHDSANVVVAWNVFRHFYPYWPESGVDWDARLGPQLALAYDATTRAAHRDAMRLSVADARDGQDGVDTRSSERPGLLPFRLGVIDGLLVVTATAAPAEVPVGAVVSTIDGVPALQRLAEAMRLASGTRSGNRRGPAGDRHVSERGGRKLVIDTGAGPQARSLPCETKQVPAEKRPEAVAEMTSGIWYVDLTRASMPQVTPVFDKLAVATGVVFDLRGYPTDAGAQILPHLIGTSEADRWMHMNKIIGPSRCSPRGGRASAGTSRRRALASAGRSCFSPMAARSATPSRCSGTWPTVSSGRLLGAPPPVPMGTWRHLLYPAALESFLPACA